MTDLPFRAALWAAVSSAAQAAADKLSLEDQADKERAVCAARRWRIAAELVVRGHSREYSSLDAGMREIPELAQLMQMARDGEINILVCYDSNRFRGLQTPVLKTLAAYGVQTYSLTQPIEPVEPDKFRYYHSDTQSIMTHVGSLLSDVELSALRRRYEIGMPKRVDALGLHYNNRLPFGYRKPVGRELDRKAVGELVPGLRGVLLELKRRYETGESADALAAWLQASKVATPRGFPWSRNQVLYILTNPYYAGLVARGKETARRDLLTGQHVHKRRPRAEWKLAPGHHAGLWSVGDYERLVEIRDRRAGHKAGVTRLTHLFSRLVVCDECGLIMRTGKPLASGMVVYRCVAGKSKAGHGRIWEPELIDELHRWLADWLSGPLPAVTVASDDAAANQAALAALAENDAARARYQRALGRGAISDSDYDARMAELAAERAGLEATADRAGDGARRAERARAVRRDASQLLENWDTFWQLAPIEINARLGGIIERIVVHGRTISEFVMRD